MFVGSIEEYGPPVGMQAILETGHYRSSSDVYTRYEIQNSLVLKLIDCRRHVKGMAGTAGVIVIFTLWKHINVVENDAVVFVTLHGLNETDIVE